MFPHVEPDAVDFDKYIQALGVDKGWKLASVIHFGEIPDALPPRPVAAVFVMFPDLQEAMNHDPFGGEYMSEIPQGLYFMKQTDNPSDAVAFISALANVQGQVLLDESKPLSSFLKATQSMSPEDRSKHLKQVSGMKSAHDASQKKEEYDHSEQGALKSPSQRQGSKMKSHTIALINFKGTLIQLDGRKRAPVNHGPTTDKTFLEDADKISQAFLRRCPMDVFFMTQALVPHYQGDKERGYFSF